MSAPVPHSIRLRGPWQFALLPNRQGSDPWTAAPSEAELRRIQLPAVWPKVLPADWRGRLWLRRVFHLPTGLRAGDEVSLVADALGYPVCSRLNGHALEAASFDPARIRWKITPWLQDRNVAEWVLDLTHPAAAAEPANLWATVIGEVLLNIEPAPVAPPS